MESFLGKPVKQVKLQDGWVTNCCEKKRVIRRESLDPVDPLIRRWIKCFPKENTFVQNFYGVPSLIIAIDCVIDEDEKNRRFGLYEIDEKPDGIGFASLLDESFRERLRDQLSWWYSSSVIVLNSPSRHGCDDYLWTKTTSNPRELSDHSLSIIRAEPDEIGKLNGFEGRSASSLIQNGSKCYGVELGLWEEVTLSDLEKLDPWPESFVLKPCRGNNSHDVMIWKRNGRHHRNEGISSENQIKNKLFQQHKMYKQGFIEPLREKEEGWNTVYRIFCAYDVHLNRYAALGGLWISRKSYKVHVTPDSVIGPLILN
jgi:hypothetical protein